MSYTKISTIALYVVAVISLVVIIFFYVSPRTVNVAELDARVEQLLTEGVPAAEPQAEAPASDTIATDSLAVDEEGAEEADSAVVAPVTTDEDLAVAEVLPSEIDLRDHLTGWELMVYKRTDYALGWAYILFIIAAIAAILFPMINIVTDVKAILRLLALLGAAAVLILVSYFVLAGDAPIYIIGYTGTDNSDPVTLKWIDTGLFSTYIMFGLALLSILYSEIAKIFK